LDVTVDGVDYDALVANNTMRDSFVANVKNVTAEQAGPGIRPEHVSVELTAGFVTVHATITPVSSTDVSAEEVQEALAGATASGALEQAVLRAVTSVPGIDDVSSGSIQLSNFDNARIGLLKSTSTTPSTSTAPPLSTVGTRAPLMGSTFVLSVVLIIGVAVIFLVTLTCKLRNLRQAKKLQERASLTSEDDLEAQMKVGEQSVDFNV